MPSQFCHLQGVAQGAGQPVVQAGLQGSHERRSVQMRLNRSRSGCGRHGSFSRSRSRLPGDEQASQPQGLPVLQAFPQVGPQGLAGAQGLAQESQALAGPHGAGQAGAALHGAQGAHGLHTAVGTISVMVLGTFTVVQHGT
jgi:hypothetical protein